MHAEWGLLQAACGRLANKRERAVLSEILDAAQEKTVLAIERMLDGGLRLGPRAMIGRGKRCR